MLSKGNFVGGTRSKEQWQSILTVELMSSDESGEEDGEEVLIVPGSQIQLHNSSIRLTSKFFRKETTSQKANEKAYVGMSLKERYY